jgi:kinesin family protein 6/9
MEGKDKKQEETIKVFCRIRPTIRGAQHIDINSDNNILSIANTKKETKKYYFDRVFGMQTSQKEMFDGAARDVVDSALDGYNGTIFAYGQTGSGKTYTMTGGVERVEDGGIIPRTIQHIFHECKKRNTYQWTVYISYLEIYNNDGYDLLYKGPKTKNLEDLPKVKIRENANRQFLLYNLSVHKIESEEDGMFLLMVGDDNRVVAETPKNDASTRSHCIFMFQIESQKIGEDVKTLSKLHIVDLSGSESILIIN